MTIRNLVLVVLLFVPGLLSAQESDASVTARLDSLLAVPEVDSLVASLASGFVSRFLIMVPDLPDEGREVMVQVATDAYGPDRVRRDIATLLSERADPDHLVELLEMRRVGPVAEWDRIAEEDQPEESFAAFVSSLSMEDQGRIQAMAGLAELQGTARLDLLIDEALTEAAADVVAGLGGSALYERLTDDMFADAYRQKALNGALDLLFRHGAATEQLLSEVTSWYRSDASRWFVDGYERAVLAAISAGTLRVLEMTTTEEDADGADEPEYAGMPCRAQACGYLLTWQGREPTDYNRRFGRSGDLDALILERLVGAGYQLQRGVMADGLTFRLTARTTYGLCEAMSGTGNTRCTAIDMVNGLPGGVRGLRCSRQGHRSQSLRR